MKKASFFILGLVLVLTAFASAAQALPFVGEKIKFGDGPGTVGGGEFYIYDAYSGDLLITTFCVERNEYINYSGTFTIQDISTEARAGGVGGGSPDPLIDIQRISTTTSTGGP